MIICALFCNSLIIDQHNFIDLTNKFNNEIMLENDNGIISISKNNKTDVRVK